MDMSAPHPSSLIPHPSTKGARPPLVYSPHPLQPARDRQIIHAELMPGETLGEYLDRTGIAAQIRHRPVRVSIDGLYVPSSFWQHCRPKPGTLIQVQALVHGGGGGGKNPVATVLSIALMIAAPQLAPMLLPAGASAFAVAATQFGINLIGSMAINALFPPPQASASQFTGAAQESPTYSLSGGSNRMRPYEPLPVIMGIHRVFPDAGARTYTEFEGEDQYLYQVFDFGYNDLTLSDFKIGTTPIGDYTGVDIQVSGADGALTLFPANVDSQAGAALDYGADYTIRTSSPASTALAVELTGSLYTVGANGTLLTNYCDVTIEYRAVGAPAWLPFYGGASSVSLASSSRKPLRATYRIDVAAGQYEVRVQRTTGVDPSNTVVREIVWSQLRSYQPDTADYTGRARVALKIKASGQLSGTVDQFSAIARAKTLAWNGVAWVTSETSNPAWWVLAAARGKSNGTRRVWGGGIPDSRIGLENIKAFGAWCDSKGLTFNGVFDQQMSVYDMLSAIALTGRGTVSRGSGLVEVVWDAPDQPAVAVFSMSNIKLDTFEIEYLSEQLADEIVCSFINPDLDWQRDVVRVLAPGVTDPVRSRTIDLFGVTNKNLAGRAANLYTATNVYRTKRYRWQTDWEGMPVSRGEVAYLSHDLASYDYSGRLIEGSTASVLKLERTVPLNAAGSFVTLVKPDGTFVTYAVQAGVGDSSTLNLAAPLAFNPGADPNHPPYDYRWLYGNTATPGKKVKVESIAMKGYDTVELTVIDENPDYYASESNPYIHVPVMPIFGNAPVVSNLQITEEGVRAGTGYLVQVGITWDAGPGYGFAEIRVSIDGGPMALVSGEIRGRAFTLTTQDNAQLAIELTAYSSLGPLGKSTKLNATKAIAFAALSPPAKIASFGITGRRLNWAASPEVDVIGYRVRFHLGNRRTWEDAAPLHDGLVTATPWEPPAFPDGQISLGVKPVDAAGLEADEAAWIITDLGDALVANVIEQQDLRALVWPGAITGGAVSAGDLIADVETVFYSADDRNPIYTTDGSAFYQPETYAAMSYETDQIVPAAPLTGSRLTIGSTLAGDPKYLDWRQIGPLPFYSPNDADPFYSASDSVLFYDAPPDYSAWPGEIVVNREPYQFRVRTGQGGMRGTLSELTLLIDAPDIEEEFNDVVIGIGGTRLPVTKPFSIIKNIQITLEDDGGTAVSVRWLDKDAALGPLIECIDSTQASVAGRVDARIKGY